MLRAGVAFFLLLSLEAASLGAAALGRHGGSHSHGGGSTGGTVHVQGYYRKDGTYVSSYDRSAPGTKQVGVSGSGSGIAGGAPGLLGFKSSVGTDFLEDPKAAVLVARDGTVQRVEGEPELRNRVVVFQDRQKRLLSLPATAIDLSATQSANGRIKKVRIALQAFQIQSGFPAGRPGYVVTYIVPLECGGTIDPSNLHWQTEEDAWAKGQAAPQCGS